ncbi:MAG: cytochrome c [Gammaproteobacteria bacterium]|nr:cytochrome c [Gammaproteobacteria bacterium]
MKLIVPTQWICIAILYVITFIVTGNAFAGNPFEGKPLYYKHCYDCHEDSGTNRMLNAPDFKKREGLMATDQQLLAVIKSGKGVMPGYQGILKDKEILDVIAYIRNIF